MRDKNGKKKRKQTFLIGVILAIIIGLFSSQIQTTGAYKGILFILVILGIVVGLLNVANQEASKFLLAGVSLVLVSFMGSAALAIIPAVGSILSALMVLFVPATIIVALKSVFEIAKS